MIEFRVLSAPKTNINSFFPYGSLLYDARWTPMYAESRDTEGSFVVVKCCSRVFRSGMVRLYQALSGKTDKV
jgi:hypothetical protein